MSNFSELGLSDPILKVLSEIGFETPTPIQVMTIPILSEKDTDFIGLAQTGTGKTAAFGLPLLQRVDLNKKQTQALILAPTRELGRQIADQMRVFAKYYPKANIQAVYGGTNITNQIKDLRDTPQILIATPGRLIDLIGRKVIKLNLIEYVVLDEADEMLNMGFKEDIDKILAFTPDEKQTWLFSATMPKEIKKIVNKYMDNPEEVSINRDNIVNKDIEHQYVVVDGRRKNEALMRFIDVHADMRGIIFCRTRMGTQNLSDVLTRNQYKADAIHGDLSQSQRDRVMKRFKAGELQLLVATDVAARGIDVDNLSHVLHHALPDDLPYYTHRSGRTARAGKKGISLAFVGKGEVRKLKTIERDLKLKFKEVQAPGIDEIMELRMSGWAEKMSQMSSEKKVDEDLMSKIQSYFEDVSKEDIIKKFALIEIGKLNLKKTITGDSPRERDGGGRGRSDRGDRGRGRSSDRGRERRGGRDRDSRGSRDRDSRGSRDRGGSSDRRDSRDRGERRERGGGKDQRKEKSRERSRTSGGVRYFINLGRVDGLNKKDLVEFLAKNGGISSQSVDNITLGDKFSFFNVDGDMPPKAVKAIDGKDIGGRKIRMNKDDE